MANIFQSPKAPDPYATAAAQTQTNQQTANYQAGLNNVNQVTPQGNLTYTQDKWPDGTPRWTATQTYSPAQQAIADQQNKFNLTANQTANNQLGQIQGVLSKPLDLSNSAVEARLWELGRQRLDPMWQQQQDQFQQNMINRGIREGSEAYNNAYQQFAQGKNDAYNNLLLSGHQTAVGDIVRERQQPINEMTALLNGQQLQNPSYVNPAQTQVAGTNLAGLIQDQYNTASQNHAAMLGGLFGLAGDVASAGMKKFSDRRLKRNIEAVGRWHNGLTVYRYQYLWDDQIHTGFMADEVEQVHPDAVSMVGGFKAVDYSKAVR